MPVRFNLSVLSPRRSAKFTLAALITIGVIALAPFTVQSWRNKSGAAGAQQTPTKEPLGQLLITIRPTGFDPREVTYAKGEFLFSVDNRSGLEAVDLALDSEHGNRLHSKRVPRENLDWRQLVNLNPGLYLLKEANHPNWVCRIQITSK